MPRASTSTTCALPDVRQVWQAIPVLRLQVDPHKCPIARYGILDNPATATEHKIQIHRGALFVGRGVGAFAFRLDGLAAGVKNRNPPPAAPDSAGGAAFPGLALAARSA